MSEVIGKRDSRIGLSCLVETIHVEALLNARRVIRRPISNLRCAKYAKSLRLLLRRSLQCVVLSFISSSSSKGFEDSLESILDHGRSDSGKEVNDSESLRPDLKKSTECSNCQISIDFANVIRSSLHLANITLPCVICSCRAWAS